MRFVGLISLAAVAALAAGCGPKEEKAAQAPPMPPGSGPTAVPGGPPMPPGPNPVGATGGAATAAPGKALYATYCQGCHGTKGEGKVPGTPVFNAAWNRMSADDAGPLAAIRDGKGRMPGYKDRLNDQQMKDVLAYVRKLAK